MEIKLNLSNYPIVEGYCRVEDKVHTQKFDLTDSVKNKDDLYSVVFEAFNNLASKLVSNMKEIDKETFNAYDEGTN